MLRLCAVMHGRHGVACRGHARLAFLMITSKRHCATAREGLHPERLTSRKIGRPPSNSRFGLAVVALTALGPFPGKDAASVPST